MTRIYTQGAEVDPAATAPITAPDGTVTGTVTKDTTLFRSGLASWKCDTGAGAAAASTGPAVVAFAASTSYYLRGYYCFSNLPSAHTHVIMHSGTLAGTGYGVRLTTGGKLQLFWGGTQVGSNSAATIVADGATWYRVELLLGTNASAQVSNGELQLDGVSVAIDSGEASSITPDIHELGWVNISGLTKDANLVLNIDDLAYNDSNGANQNSWPGSGKIVLLSPISDNAGGTGWTLGTGTALGGNGFVSVDNKPPQGVADQAVGSDPEQIRNAANAASSNYDANLTSYTTAGIATADTINVIVPFANTASISATSAKQGTIGVASNPAITNVALSATGVAGAFWNGTVAAGYPTGWKWSYGTITYNPTVTLGTSPVIRVTQVTGNTRIAMVDFLGMYVDYTPAASSTENFFGQQGALSNDPSSIQSISQAVKRGATY